MKIIISLLVAVVAYLFAAWLLPMLNIPSNIVQVLSLLIAALAGVIYYRGGTWQL